MPHRRLLATFTALSLAAAAALPAAAQDERPHGPPEATPNPAPLEVPAGDGTAVRLVTELGDVVIGLFNESAPVAAENFRNLAREGFYDCVGFHRAVPGFVLQGGDPDGTGGGGPGYTIEDEEVVGQYARGIVAMARTPEPNSQGSQFFIVLDDAAEPALETYRTYTILGHVVEGMDIVDAIVEARAPSDRIADPVRIVAAAIEQSGESAMETSAPGSAADGLVAKLPEQAGGYDLETTVYALADLGGGFDCGAASELHEAAVANGSALDRLSLAVASGADEAGFVSLAAASLPGVPAEQVEAAMTRVLLPDLDLSGATGQVFGERTASVVDLGDGRSAYVFTSDDVVWFVVTSSDEVEPIITALP